MTGPDLPPLTDTELVQLAELLARFVAHDLDQFDHWVLHQQDGSVFVDIWQGRPATLAEDVYTQVWPVPEHLRRNIGEQPG